MILCDIGNTTYHFKTKEKNFKISIGKLKYIKELDKQIYFISVNKKATKMLFKLYPNAINLNNYIKFDTLYKGMGIDRKVVCKGIANGIIVDFGSAITVDIVKNNIHKGGFILPGIQSYKKIYSNISKKLIFNFEKNINLDKIPLNTNCAINYAIYSSIALPILKIYQRYNLTLYFTGGDRYMFVKQFINTPIKYKKNMIFKSMKKIIKDIKKENIC